MADIQVISRTQRIVVNHPMDSRSVVNAGPQGPPGVPGPPGTIYEYIGTTSSDKFLILDGRVITDGRVLYPRLWAVIPESWKSGNDIHLEDTRGQQTVNGTAVNKIICVG